MIVRVSTCIKLSVACLILTRSAMCTNKVDFVRFVYPDYIAYGLNYTTYYIDNNLQRYKECRKPNSQTN